VGNPIGAFDVFYISIIREPVPQSDSRATYGRKRDPRPLNEAARSVVRYRLIALDISP